MAQWFRWFPGDYTRDTGTLSLTEHGAYRVLLDHYYSTGGKLRADMVSLFRLCRAMEEHEQAAVGKVVRDFFTVDDDGWLRNKRADKEVAEAVKYHRDASERAKHAAEARWSNAPSNAPSMPQASAEQCRENAIPQPQPQKTNTKTKQGAFALPDWVPVESWEGWLEVRAKNKAPNTERALKLALADLTKLRGQGHDPAQILDTATARGWRGLFAPKPEAANEPTDWRKDPRFQGVA